LERFGTISFRNPSLLGMGTKMKKLGVVGIILAGVIYMVSGTTNAVSPVSREIISAEVSPAVQPAVSSEVSAEVKTVPKEIKLSPALPLKMKSDTAEKTHMAWADTGGAPKSFFDRFGEKAKHIWDSVINEPMENIKKSSLSMPFKYNPRAENTEDSNGELGGGGYRVGKTEDGAVPSHSTASTSPEVKRGEALVYVSWKMRDACEGTKISGFMAKVFTEKQTVLKQTFIPAATNDPYGCKEYRLPLKQFLPEDMEEFTGSLSIAGMVDDKETGELVWENLVKPRSLGVGGAGFGSLTIQWDLNKEPTVAGYKFYFGQEPGRYTRVMDVGNASRFQVMGLAVGTWYFTCTAYDKMGNESAYAQEVSKVVKSPTPTLQPAL